MDLSELGNARLWDNLIAKANQIDTGVFTPYEREFVANMIYRDEKDRPMWSPSRKQYNLLHTIINKVY